MHRNENSIMLEALEICRTGALKTHLMYQSNMSYTMLQKFLSKLIEFGLVEEKKITITNRIHTAYYTTKKGIEYIKLEKMQNDLIRDDDYLK